MSKKIELLSTEFTVTEVNGIVSIKNIKTNHKINISKKLFEKKYEVKTVASALAGEKKDSGKKDK